MSDLPFCPFRRVDGYPLLEDLGLIGDGATAALVARDGTVCWLCIPRFDSPPLFQSLLDARRGGAFRLTVEGLVESRQRYEADSGVLVTELRGREGVLRITDALTLRSGADLAEDLPVARQELVRSAVVLGGRVRVRVEIDPYGEARAERRADGFRIVCDSRPDLDLQLTASRALEGLETTFELESGEALDVVLRWSGGSHRHRPIEPPELLAGTLDAWRRWMGGVHYEGPEKELVRRSAVTLKLLDHMGNGAIVAAPTSSLPEALGGPRNWDYRYAWVRDAAFSVYAMRRVGLDSEAFAFLAWVLDAASSEGAPRVLYDVGGGQPPPEREDEELEGYRHSPPVRWGNGAADQHQHDVYGEIVDCAYQWAARGGKIDDRLWANLRSLVEAAAGAWRQPDHGIWEVRSDGRVFTYSAAMCQVALDRGVRIAERLGHAGDTSRWQAEADRIAAAILDEAWDEEVSSLTESLGGGGLDASVLSLPLRRVVDVDHPKMVATTTAVAERLGAGDGLLYRYLPDESPDGLPGHEGAFLLCSFWLVDNLAGQGRVDEAMALYESLCRRAGPLGLLPEQIDPGSGRFLGNHPQAFSHVGVISSGVNLARRLERR